MKFSDIPHLTQWGDSSFNVSWNILEKTLADYEKVYGLDLDPDFQRGHVWNERQQRAFVEFVLRGGKCSRHLLFNSATWGSGKKDPLVLVDGKQRLTAVLKFIRNELYILEYHGGLYYRDFQGAPRQYTDFIFVINYLQTRYEVLEWYLEVNAGTPHSNEELERVRGMLEEESSNAVS